MYLGLLQDGYIAVIYSVIAELEYFPYNHCIIDRSFLLRSHPARGFIAHSSSVVTITNQPRTGVGT
jgi:hypothetical protein